MSSDGRTLDGIQYLRGFAALAVVLDHATGMASSAEYFGGSPSSFLSAGWIGVPVFFVISGFIITIVSLDANLSAK